MFCFKPEPLGQNTQENTISCFCLILLCNALLRQDMKLIGLHARALFVWYTTMGENGPEGGWNSHFCYFFGVGLICISVANYSRIY